MSNSSLARKDYERRYSAGQRGSSNIRMSRSNGSGGSGSRSAGSDAPKRSLGERLGDTVGYVSGMIKDRSQGFDAPLFWIIIALVVAGLIMLYSASYAYCYYKHEGNSNYLIIRQLLFAVAGVAVMLLASFYPAEKIKKYTLVLYGVSILLLSVVLLLPEIEHVHRWIDLGFTTFQPSEIAKLAVLVLCATWADSHGDKMNTLMWGVLPFIVFLVPVVALLLLEPHISCTVLVLLIAMTLMFVGGTDFKWFAGLLGVASVGIVGIILSGKIVYAGNRITAWLDPYSDKQGVGWQTLQSLYAISSGGLLGQGLGQSRQKYLYVSAPHNDMIFSVVCEELGFVGAVVILVLFFAFIYRGLTISVANPNRFCKLMGIGITAQIGWQTFLNIAVVTNTIPNTGVSLPFFSYGGTSLLMLLLEMGILLSISRNSTQKKI